jgi:hypothetical protein
MKNCHLAKVLIATVLLAIFAIPSSAIAHGEALTKQQNFERFLSWFAGEYDNHEQVWQQEVDEVPEKERHENIHHIFLPVEAPGVGDNTFFIRQYQDGNYEEVYRQRLYNFRLDEETGKIRLQIFKFSDEVKYRDTDQDPSIIKSLMADEVSNMPGCDVFWSYKDGVYVGEMVPKACFFFSKRSNGNIYITDTLYLSETNITINDEGFNEAGDRIFGRDVAHDNRKVSYFKGWAAIRKNLIDDTADEEEMVFFSDLRIHNEGQIVPLVTKEGVETGYSIQLARLTYQNTNTAILKLGLIDKEGKTFTYIWANPAAKRIGINLRWMQVGLTGENL